MTITRVGTNEKYASGWEAIFGGRKARTSKAAPSVSSKTSSKTKSVKKAAKKATKKSVAKPVAKKASKKSR